MASAVAALERVLVAGSTGYLGGFVVQALRQHGVQVTALVGPHSSGSTVEHLTALGATTVRADVSKPSSLAGACDGMDAVVSCLAAGLNDIWAVDSLGNMALFDEAARAGVQHFMLVATSEGREARAYSKLSRAKEEAVDYITQRARQQGIRCSIIRPTAYFKDFTDHPWKEVREGKDPITIVGNGTSRFNPVDGGDLAEFMVSLLLQPPKQLPVAEASSALGAAPASASSQQQQQQQPAAGEQVAAAVDASSASGSGLQEPSAAHSLVMHYPVGGPQVLTLLQVFQLAAEVQGRDPQSLHFRRVPLWLVRLVVLGCRLLGWLPLPGLRRLRIGLEFVVYAAQHDSIGEAVGTKTVRQCYEEKLRQERQRGGDGAAPAASAST